MKERDKARQVAARASGNEKVILMKRYRHLRNDCNRRVRQDSKRCIGDKILEGGGDSAIWNEVHNILNP